jgi:glycosyltransferase involved in cell wall biosynthesis
MTIMPPVFTPSLLDYAAVIPCLNEAATIRDLVLKVRRHVPLVVVVDDGSADDSAALAVNAGATVLSHSTNLGKGAALRTGLNHARALGFAWAFTLDADGQHAPEDFCGFIQCAEQTDAALIVGNRMHDARAIPWLRRQVNRWMSRQLSVRAGRHLPDTQCGFRLMRLDVWTRLSLQTNHFEVESEMTMAFLEAGYEVAFAPIRVIGRGPASHIQPLQDSVRWWKWWRSLAPQTPSAVAQLRADVHRRNTAGTALAK